MQLRADAGAGQPQVGDRDRRQQLLRRLQEVDQRQPIVLVVVLAFLVADGRPEQHGPVDRLRQVGAQRMPAGVRQRVDRKVHQRSARRCELGILTAAGEDRERLSAQDARDFVCVHARGVDDELGEDRFAFGPQHGSLTRDLGADQGRRRQEDRSLGLGSAP